MSRSAGALALLFAACDPPASAPTPPPTTGDSAEAASTTVVPQPRSAGPVASTSVAAPLGSPSGSALPPPEPLALREKLLAEALATAKAELAGVDLEARWAWPRRFEGSGDEARSRSALDVEVKLTANGRMRWVFRGGAVMLPAGTELLARADHYGHLLVWPDKPEYRVVPAGTLRSLLDERRVDASPLSKATRATLGEGARLGLPVRRVELTSSYGTVTLELARVKEAGLGGVVWCRLLVELGGIDPALAPCAAEPEPELPLQASYAWGTSDAKEALRLEVSRLVLHEKDAAPILVPAPGQRMRADGIPGSMSAAVASDDELLVLGGKEPTGAKTSPRASLAARNRSDRAMFLILNGIPVGYVAPHGRLKLDGLRATTHRVAWRSFLGDEATPPGEAAPDSTVRHPADGDGDDEVTSDDR
ncbi:MAG: hypothetical protein FJ095_10375 [Deltaproteobacteria bacterium]|nr:hypothetical protein [Deltaproteobacteria bacterium]